MNCKSTDCCAIPAHYDVNSLARGKLAEGLVLFVFGTVGLVSFLISFIANFLLGSDLHLYGVFPELIVLGIVLFVSSLYMLYEGTVTIRQSGLTPFWKCSDKRVRRFYVTFGGTKPILSSMALYDIEPEVRDLALQKLERDEIIDSYIKARESDPYLYVDNIENMIAVRKKLEEQARIEARTGLISEDATFQLTEILKANPSVASARIIIGELSDKVLLSELASNKDIKPLIKDILKERLKNL